MASWEAYKQTMAVPRTLGVAAQANDLAELTRLLDAGAPIDERDHRGYSPLMLAVYAGHTDAAELLLARRADPNSRDHAGNTILMGAAFKGHVQLFRRLLACGADASLRNAAGMDARAFAVMFGRAAVVAELDSAVAAA